MVAIKQSTLDITCVYLLHAFAGMTVTFSTRGIFAECLGFGSARSLLFIMAMNHLQEHEFISCNPHVVISAMGHAFVLSFAVTWGDRFNWEPQYNEASVRVFVMEEANKIGNSGIAVVIVPSDEEDSD